jgi:hypothetical protein
MTSTADAIHDSRIGAGLPPFWCPIPPARHPAAARLESRALAWVDQHGLYQDSVDRAWGIATHSTDFSCRMIPSGDEEKLLLFILWNHWAFALDDTWHDTGSTRITTAHIVDFNTRVARALELPGSAMLPPGTLTAALDDLVARTRALTTPVEFRRIADGLRDWLFGAAWQASNTERGVMPSLSDYVAVRPAINGTRFSLAWSQLAADIRTTDEELSSAPVQALVDAAGFVVSCDNDLFSYAKEDDQETLEQNIVNILAHWRGCSPREALPAAVALRDRVLALVLRGRERIARGASPELRRYLDFVAHYIRGCVDWMNNAPRYASPRNRHRLPVPGASYHIVWREGPTDGSAEAPGIDAMQWWWEQLGC